jgi:hypothetical protein
MDRGLFAYNNPMYNGWIIAILQSCGWFYFIFPGKLVGCYVGKCSGSIRSIVRHPELPLIASCGE